MLQLDFTTATARKAITLVLGIIMLTGTITSFYTTSSSSSFIKTAQAQSVDKGLEDIDCDNINLNGTDIPIDTLPKSLGGLADLIQSEAGDSSISNSEQRVIENFIYKCIKNNENEFNPSQAQPPIEEGATLSINKEWFVCNNFVIDCIIEPQEEGEQISFEGPNSGIYIQCTSNGQCGANDAGFNITISGNSPTPNTIPAQINTEQQVQIGAGSFSVSEELFSDRFVPDAIFGVEDVPVGDIEFGDTPVPLILAFDPAGNRVFTANSISDSVSIIDLLSATVGKICQDSGFDTGDIRTFESFGRTNQQISCVNFVGECSGNINDGETKECTVEDYIVSLAPTNDDGIGILSNMNNSQQRTLFTNDIYSTENKIKPSSLPTRPSINMVPIH